jgi:RNA polymerase sigma-70 factor (ECF subfamily)
MIWPFTRRSPSSEQPVPLEVELETLDDRELLALASQHNTEAFAVIYARYRMVVYRYVTYRTLQQQVAEDLTAEVFLNAWSAIGRYQDRGVGVRAWLLRLAHNEVIDHYRTRRPGAPLSDDETRLPWNEGPEAAVELAADQWALVRAVQQLNPDWQQLILLRFVEGLSFDEIGVVMGKQSNACRQMQHRALARLRELLSEARPGDE